MYFMHPKARRKEGALATIPYPILLSLKVSLNTDIQLRFNCISLHWVLVFLYAPAIRRMVEGHKVLPLPVRAFVRQSEIWCPFNNFWKTASIQFKSGMLIYNIKTQVNFDLGFNPLSFDWVMGLLCFVCYSTSYVSSFRNNQSRIKIKLMVKLKHLLDCSKHLYLHLKRIYL